MRGKRKKKEPFKGDYVPQSAIVVFILKYKQIFDLFHKRLEAEKKMPRVRHIAFRKDPNYKFIAYLLQKEFNYTDATTATGDVVMRCVRIYRKNNLQNNGTGTIRA
jgi:hypothetical protein